MRRPVLPLLASALVALALLLPGPADAKTRRKRRAPRKAARPPAVRPYYGPPAPTAPPWLRAAGACMDFTPGQHLVVAEVGATGRVFRIDGETRIEADVRKGARVRVLYVDGPGGPVARKVLPGPVASTAAPKAP